MDVLDAIKSRKSIRAFKPDPVPRETLAEILAISQRAPSGTNTQPWHTWICTGEVKDAITRDVLTMLERGESKAYHDYDYYPAWWNDVHNARRRAVGYSLYALLGITKAATAKAPAILRSSTRRSASLLRSTNIWHAETGPTQGCTSRRSCWPRRASASIHALKRPGFLCKTRSSTIWAFLMIRNW